MYILGIDSTTNRLSAAISRTEDIDESTADLAFHIEYGDRERFMTQIIPAVDGVLKKAGAEIKSMDYYCVNCGPGDFTGTRIGLSVIKTLAMIFKKPAYAIGSSDVFAQQAAFLNAAKMALKIRKGLKVFIVPVIDVKRGEVFFSVYDISLSEKINTSGKIINAANIFFTAKIYGDVLCSWQDFVSTLQGFFNSADGSGFYDKNSVLFFCGSAFESYKNLGKEIKAIKNAILASGRVFNPQAQYINQCALYRIYRKQESDKNIKPYYVRDFTPFKKTQKTI